MKKLIILLPMVFTILLSCKETKNHVASGSAQKSDILYWRETGNDSAIAAMLKDDSLANVATEQRLRDEVRGLIVLLDKKVSNTSISGNFVDFDHLTVYRGEDETYLGIIQDGGNIFDIGADGFSSRACIDCKDYDSYHRSIYLDQKVLEKRRSRLEYFKTIQIYKAKLQKMSDKKS